MPTASNPPPSDPKMKRALHKRHEVYKMYMGCAVLLFLGGIGIVGFRFFHAALTSALTPSDPASIMVSDPAISVFYLAAVVGVLGMLAVGAVSSLRKTPVLGVAAFLVLIVVGPPAVYFICYDSFWAVIPKAGTVKLIYLWPWPDQILQVSKITDVDVERGVESVRGAVYPLFRLRIRAGERTWTSEWSRNDQVMRISAAAVLREKNATKPNGREVERDY